MKRVVLLVALAALFLSTAAVAGTSMTYFTTGKFSTTGTNVLTIGGTLTYVGQPSTTLFLNPYSFAKLGTFVESGNLTIPSPEQFTLTIWQTAPGGGSATDVGTIAGTFTVSPSNSSVTLVFAAPYFTYQGNTYSTPTGSPIDKIAWGVFKNTSISVQDTTTLQGVAINTPEPSSLLMLGAGLSGLVGLIRRKRA